jgi:2-(3-amino-3-carboxypropyl)histidine synthase
MEDDRAQVDLGIAADIEEAQLTQAHQSQSVDEDASQATTKQPKKRFVGRRAAAEAAAKNTANHAEGESGAIQGSYETICLGGIRVNCLTHFPSRQAKTSTSSFEQSPQGDPL